VLSVAAVWLLISIDEPPRTPAPRRHVLHELHEGAVFVLGHRWLRPILATTVVWNLAWFILVAAYVPYAVATLHLDAAAIGTTLAVMGVGMIVTSLLAPRLLPKLPFGMALVVGPVTSVVASFAMVATIWWPSFALASLSYFLFGAGPVLWTISQITLRQTVTPNELLGRVSALFMTASAGSRPIGAAIGGFIGETWGLQACLIASFAVFVGQMLVILCSPLPAVTRLPRSVPGV